MAHKIYIGIDNGHTGTMGWVGENLHPSIIKAPTTHKQSYTQKKQKITRVDHFKVTEWFKEILGANEPSDVLVILERPMTNNNRGRAVVSAARAFEVTWCLVEQMRFDYVIIDSKRWQKVMLPPGIKGSDNLKAASMEVGLKLFPDQSKVITSHKDADGLLMAEWARRVKL